MADASASLPTGETGFAGRTVVVTGAAQGIGAAIARRFVRAGASVVIADIQDGLAAQTAEEIGREASGSAEAVHLDVSDPSAVARAAQELASRRGGVDVLVNNAGVVSMAATLEHSDGDWAHTIATNLSGPFYCSREFARTMDGGGAIVSISSIAAFKAVRPELHIAYDVSKAGVAHMTRCLAAEWAPKGIRVNAVAPGYTNTAILDEVGRSEPETFATWLSHVPFGRLMEPREIAEAVVFLASEAASGITGAVLAVDGGYLAW